MVGIDHTYEQVPQLAHSTWISFASITSSEVSGHLFQNAGIHTRLLHQLTFLDLGEKLR